MLCLVGHQGPHVWIDSSLQVFKVTNVSRVEDGQFKFQVQQCAFDVQLQL